jgi:type I restriction enzyme S subunit
MIEGLKPYPEYKESGSKWLGQIPLNWEVRNLRTLIIKRTDRNRPDLPLLSVAREKGVFIRSLTNTDENHNVIPDDLSNYKVARTGSLVINKMKAWQGSMGIAPCDGIVSPAYYVFDLRIDNHAFGQRLLRSKPYVAHFAQASDGVRVGQWDLSIPGMRQIPVLIPSGDEQAAIVRFLDHTNRKIDRFIRAKRKLTGLLNEQKQAIIHRAVTRGLNPDVKLMPSGIPWLGDIPEHWEVITVGAGTKLIQTGPFGSQMHSHEYVLGETPIINPSHMRDGRVLPDPEVAVSKAKADELFRHRMLNGDIVVARRGELGRCALITENEVGWLCGTGSLLIRIKPDVYLPAYFQEVLSSQGVSDLLRLTSVGATMDNLNAGMVARLRFPLPPLAEQHAITAQLARERTKNRDAISMTEREIALMQEYRTRLTADVVTGKLDVRSAAVQLPELEEDAVLEGDSGELVDDLEAEGVEE